MMKIIASVLGLGLLFQPGAEGTTLTERDLSPLLRVNVSLTTRAPLIDPFTNLVDDRDVFVSRGGALVSTRINKGFTNVDTTLVRGVAEPGQLASIVQALAVSRIGFQQDCQIHSPGLEEGGPLGTIDLTWYGRGIRRNAFTVIYAVEGTSLLPSCPAAVGELLAAIAAFETAVFENPSTEVLQSE